MQRGSHSDGEAHCCHHHDDERLCMPIMRYSSLQIWLALEFCCSLMAPNEKAYQGVPQVWRPLSCVLRAKVPTGNIM